MNTQVPWTGITGGTALVHGAMGAVAEYKEIMNALEDQCEVTERILNIARERFERWRDDELPYLLETQEWAIGLDPGQFAPNCGLIFSKWDFYSERVANAAISMDERWRDRWHLGEMQYGHVNDLAGVKGTLMAVAHITMFRSMMHNYYAALEVKDQAVMSVSGGAQAHEVLAESSRLLTGAAMGYNQILGLHVNSMTRHLGVAGAGAAKLANGGVTEE